MSQSITIAHLSDVHLSPLLGFTPRYWNAKRALGFINWQRKRRYVHLREMADRIVADTRAQAPDHIAVTGDLINIGLPAEYDAAMRWLATLGSPSEVSLVPGNHDIYSHLGRDPGVERWRAYMTSDAWGLDFETEGRRADRLASLGRLGQAPDLASSTGFPYVRRVGPVAIVGLCSAVKTAPGAATGKLGPEQIAATATVLKRLASEPVFRLVMIHHPPVPGQTRERHALIDAAALTTVLATAGAELVLHGHTHLPTVTQVQSRIAPGLVHVVGVGSASAGTQRGNEPLAQYNLLRISGTAGAWVVSLTRRGFRAGTERIESLESRTLS